MAPTYLLIDQGNSRLKIAIATQERLYPTQLYVALPTVSQLLDLIQSYHLSTTTIHAIYSSVGQVDEIWLEEIQKVCALFVVLNTDTPLPLQEIAYDRRGIGVDRLSSVIGVAKLSNEPCLVVDIGTAITYDLLLPERRYVGGNISPGPKLRLQALHDYTARLPLVPWTGISTRAPLWEQTIGQQTEQAIWLGVARGIVYEIDGYIDDLKKLYPNLNIWLTGGYAGDFAKWLKNRNFVKSNLVELGLRDILVYQTVSTSCDQ